jgi:hypothetical protein
MERRAGWRFDGGHLLRFVAALFWLTSAACYVPVPWQVGIPLAIAGTAIATAVVISATAPPPPPRVVYVPPPQPGYAWQPGYWTRRDGRWVWIDGRWIALQPGYSWVPTHWIQAPDGSWRLIQGAWVPASP